MDSNFFTQFQGKNGSKKLEINTNRTQRGYVNSIKRVPLTSKNAQVGKGKIKKFTTSEFEFAKKNGRESETQKTTTVSPLKAERPTINTNRYKKQQFGLTQGDSSKIWRTQRGSQPHYLY